MLHFRDLQESLRRLLSERVDSGETTQSSLAEEIAVRQAHLSNFLNHKRGLSLSAMDRVLDAERLSILDLVPPEEIHQRMTLPAAVEGDYANVLVVDARHAWLPQLLARDVLDVVKLKQSVLRRMRANIVGDREHWMRFVLVKPSREDCEAMRPRLTSGSLVLLDRHYNALTPYRRKDDTMFAVRCGDELLIRYASLEGSTLALQGQTHKSGLRMVHVPAGSQASELVVGRVGMVLMET